MLCAQLQHGLRRVQTGFGTAQPQYITRAVWRYCNMAASPITNNGISLRNATREFKSASIGEHRRWFTQSLGNIDARSERLAEKSTIACLARMQPKERLRCFSTAAVSRLHHPFRYRSHVVACAAAGLALGIVAAQPKYAVKQSSDGQTVEPLDLEALAEARKEPPLTLLRRLVHWISNMLEPVMTIWRFCQLLLIFLPCIITLPLTLVGKPVPERGNEPAGRIFWYDLLARQMEWAGPSFIKVSIIDHNSIV
jgi:hypothetical protein